MKKLELNEKGLVEILEIQSPRDPNASKKSEKEMRKHILKKVRDIEGTKTDEDDLGNIIVEKGNAKLKTCVCSHIDTVHNYSPSFELIFDGNKISATPVGVGGDDKCGIYACIELLKNCDNLKAIFFSREEIGCVGSSNIDLKHFDNCKCLIGIDRRDAHNLITSYHSSRKIEPLRTVSDEFFNDVKDVADQFGYFEETGFKTDVFAIQKRMVPGTTLSAINVSCGYYNPHTNAEYIVTNELEHSINFVKSIIDSLKDTKYIL